jgi:NAD-dependent SIR2 family protein deacetylase
MGPITTLSDTQPSASASRSTVNFCGTEARNSAGQCQLRHLYNTMTCFVFTPRTKHNSANVLQVSRCEVCRGLVKPDIVFFGEPLPGRFFSQSQQDMPSCDLLIIMGTSLVVYPFASLQNLVGDRCPRLLVNREKVGQLDISDDNVRDAMYLGDCDDGVSALAELLGWSDELKALQTSGGKATASEATAAETRPGVEAVKE